MYLKVFEVFWPIPIHLHNFERTGVEARGRRFKLKYGSMIADEKCENEVDGVKGAGGVKCCLSCLNCVRTQQPTTAGSGLVAFTEADMSNFERNTPDMLSVALDHLAAQKGVIKKTQFAQLEKHVGLVYDDCVLLYSPELVASAHLHCFRPPSLLPIDPSLLPLCFGSPSSLHAFRSSPLTSTASKCFISLLSFSPALCLSSV